MSWIVKARFYFCAFIFICMSFILFPRLTCAQTKDKALVLDKNTYFTEQNILDYLKKEYPEKYNEIVILRKESINKYTLQLLSYYEELRLKENLKNNNPELYKVLQGDLSASQETAILNYIKTDSSKAYSSIVQLRTNNITAYKERLTFYKNQIYASEDLKNNSPELYKNMQDYMQLQEQDPSIICKNLATSKITKKEAEKQLLETIQLNYKKKSISQQASLARLKQKLNNAQALEKHSNLEKKVINSYINEAKSSLKTLELTIAKFKHDTTDLLNTDVANILRSADRLKNNNGKGL